MGIKPSVQRILKKYDRSIFKFSPNFLKVNFPLENVGENVGVTTIKLNNTQKIIISLINQDKYITQVEISEKLNKNIRTIEINMKKLQEKNLIVRVGSDTTGYWNVNE